MQTRILTLAIFGAFTLTGCSSLMAKKAEPLIVSATQKSGKKSNPQIKKSKVSRNHKIEVKCAVSRH